MAADADALAKRLALGGFELRFLLVHHKVSDEIQCELYQNGIDSIAKFAASATDEADLKQMLKDPFSIDPSASLKLRAQAAGVVVAWKTATLRVERQAEAEATNEVRDTAKPIPSTDYIAMRQAFAAKFGDLEDRHIPAKEYIEKKLAELESGNSGPSRYPRSLAGMRSTQTRYRPIGMLKAPSPFGGAGRRPLCPRDPSSYACASRSSRTR